MITVASTTQEAEIRARILSAFFSMKHPGNDAILPYKRSDRYIPPSYQHAGKKFWDKDWLSFDLNSLLYSTLDNVLLSPSGAAYFSPAFLLATLERDSRGVLFEFHEEFLFAPTQFQLTSWRAESLESAKSNRVAVREKFSFEQRCAVAAYLRFVSEHPIDPRDFAWEGALASLDEFWAKY